MNKLNLLDYLVYDCHGNIRKEKICPNCLFGFTNDLENNKLCPKCGYDLSFPTKPKNISINFLFGPQIKTK